MTTQTQNRSISLSYFIDFILALNSLSGASVGATSLDYGFDFDEQELAGELLAPSPANLSGQPAPMIEAEEFDSLYKWFIS